MPVRSRLQDARGYFCRFLLYDIIAWISLDGDRRITIQALGTTVAELVLSELS